MLYLFESPAIICWSLIIGGVGLLFIDRYSPTPKHEAAHNCGKGHEGCFGAGCVEWKTHAENVADMVRHGTRLVGDASPGAKLSRDQVAQIYRLKPSGPRLKRTPRRLVIESPPH